MDVLNSACGLVDGLAGGWVGEAMVVDCEMKRLVDGGCI